MQSERAMLLNNIFYLHLGSAGAAFSVTYATEFLLLSAARLMVLDRMSDFVAPRGEGRKRWVVGRKIVFYVAVLGNVVGLAANVAAAVHFQKASEARSAASTSFAANNTNDGRSHTTSFREQTQLGISIMAVQSFCEVAVLLLIVAAFVVVGVLCARIISSRLRTVDAASPEAAAGRTLQLQVVVTTSFVFVACLVDSVVSTLLAVANQFQDSAKTCPGSLCDASCYNVCTHITQWNGYTPQFQPLVELISSPLALLLALWGMTTKLTLQLIKSSHRETAPLRTLSQ
jgi:hypothetical protein